MLYIMYISKEIIVARVAQLSIVMQKFYFEIIIDFRKGKSYV
mgnify:CR=1 FL=1